MDNQIFKDFEVSPTRDNRYVLTRDFKYRGYTYPRLFITNGGDIPIIFRSIFLPFEPKLLPAFLVHDYWCEKEKYKYADKIFSIILKDLGIKSWKRFLLVKAVEVYHFAKKVIK